MFCAGNAINAQVKDKDRPLDGIWFKEMVNDNIKVGKADNILNFGLKHQSLKVGCGNFSDFANLFTTFNINMDNKDADDVNAAKKHLLPG